MTKQFVVTLLVTVPTDAELAHPRHWDWDGVVNQGAHDEDYIPTPTELLGVVTLKNSVKRSSILCH